MTENRAIRFHRTGDPDVLQWEAVEVLPPGSHEVRVRHHAVGLNYVDTYFRTGLYPASLPSGIGKEAAGVVEAVGDAVSEFAPGDRVAYAGGPLGAYAQSRVIPAEHLVKLPETISFEQGAAMMLKGMTAQYLLRRTYRVQRGETILVHAAAGGVGLLLCQWARALGVTVIGTVGSEEKAALAHANGCTYPILYARERFTQRVREITQGEGVSVVYDSVGKDTFYDSLACLRPLGMMVLFGASSGPVDAFDCSLLAQMGSLFLTRPSLFSYVARRTDLLQTANELFEVVASGAVSIGVHQRYALAEAAAAHRDLEARRTTGATLLLPT